MEKIFANIWAGIVGGSWLDPVNFVLGLAGVWLMVRRSLWAFPVGMAGVTVQGILFFQTKIYADGALQIRVTRTAADNMVARILHLVEEAQASKSPTATTAMRSGRYQSL